MAVIVKGITMPESCEDCRFILSFGPCYKLCCAANRKLIVTDLVKDSHDECPLCEVVLGLDIANGEDFTGGV